MAAEIVTGESREAVAYALFLDCLYAGQRLENGHPKTGMSEADILGLFANCLAAVEGKPIAIRRP